MKIKTFIYVLLFPISVRTVDIQQEVACGVLEKLRAVRDAITCDKKSELARTLVKDLVKTLDPKEKRKREFVQRMIIGQQEAQAYAVRKNAPEPVISFYIPVYNRENVVSDAIESIYNQKLTVPFEIVVVDDASTDKTCEVLEQYEKKYNNFFLYKHDVNKKAPATRNTGIVHCRGPWLFNVDSDDILRPGTVQELLDAVQKNSADVGLFGECYFFSNLPLRRLRATRGALSCGFATMADCLKGSSYGMPFTPGCRLFSKRSIESVGGFIEAGGHDTWSLSFLQLAHGCKTYVVPDCGYLHRLWRNRASYTCQQIAKHWSTSPLIALCEYEELFDASSVCLLVGYKKTGKDFFRSGTENLRVIEQNTCVKIQEIYRLMDSAEYTRVVESVRALEKEGFVHTRLFVYQLEAAVFAGEYEQALHAIDALCERMREK